MPLAPQSNNPTMKRYILSMSLIAAFLMSACGEKSNTPEAKKAKLESLKKEIAQLQAEASALEMMQAETELRAANNNYMNALYDLVISKIELQHATGTPIK